MSEKLGWKLVVKDKTGKIVKVRRNLPEREAKERKERALKRGFKVEVEKEPQRRSRQDRRYINHPRARRCAA
jgi:hypothetical protein